MIAIACYKSTSYSARMKHITGMSLKELLAHDAAVQRQITVAKTTTVNKLRKQFVRKAKTLGLQENDFFLGTPEKVSTWGVAKPSRVPRVEVVNISRIAKGITAVRPRGAAAKRSTRVGKKVAVKYKNKKTGETWTGRGRMATWLATAIKGGKKLESFLVKQT